MAIVPASSYLTPEEIRDLSTKTNWQGWLVVGQIWGTTALIFLMAGLFPNVLTIILAIILLGGRQLACAIIMHDGGHFSIFKNKELNTFVGKWLGAYPIMSDVLRYREYHLRHHINNGTTEDPDISLTKGYPTTVASMMRKFFRDLSGLTGLKTQVAFTAMQLNYLTFSLSREVQKINQKDRSWAAFFRTAYQNLSGPITAQLLLYGILWICGAGWLYLLWLAALLTSYTFCIRVRSMSEHALIDDSSDPIRNTRTTIPFWWEKWLFAPMNVNYHVEHHMLMAVPSYHLPKMHRLLKERGFYQKGVIENGYLNIIRMAMQLKPLPHAH
ncbi:MAG: fatty acid desaturase family protein [Bacteroidota bacterium]